MNSLVNAQLELEISASVIQHQLERFVAQIDVPLVVPGVLPINLGRLAGGRVEAFRITSDGIHVELSFERGRRTPVRIDLRLSAVHFNENTQTLALTVEQLKLSGLTPLSALVNPLRGQLIKGAVQAANQRVPGLLSVTQNTHLELHLDVLTSHALSEAGENLRAALEPLLPVPANAQLRVLGLELTSDAVELSAQVAV